MILGTLRDLVPATLLKVAVLHECFSCFVNYANGTKSRNTSHLILNGTDILIYFSVFQYHQLQQNTEKH